MTEVKVRKPYPVKIGSLTLYCENMRFSTETSIYHSISVTGYPLMTKKERHAIKLTFTGRVYNKSLPMHLAGSAANSTNREGVEIIYRDLRFPNCTVTGFSAEDCGEDYITLTVNAITFSTIGYLYGVSI